MEGSLRARSDFAESASGGCRASVSHLCRKMSLCNAYRSFAIYLLIVILISESPVSAFAIRRPMTTTLSSAEQDLAAEASALLEVKSELSKLNHERDYVKFGTRKSPIKHSTNYLRADKIFASGGNKNVIQSTTVKLSNENDVTKLPENTTIRKDTDTTTHPIFRRGERFKTRTEIDAATKKDILILKTSTQSPLKAETVASGIEENATISGDSHWHNKSQNVDVSDYSSTSTECSEGSSETEETQTVDTVITTTDKPEQETSTVTTEKEQDSTADSETAKEEIIIYQIIKKSTTPPTDTTHYETGSTKLNEDKKESTVTESTALKETMVGEFSSSSSKDPSWRKYTIIERRRTNPTTVSDSFTTVSSEELEKAESVSSKVTLENAVGATSDQLKELAPDAMTATIEVDHNLSSTLQEVNVSEIETKQLLSTQPLSSETTTEVKSRDFLASRRAGFLDLSDKQNADEASTTEQFEDGKYNETELLGSMFEMETQDNDGPDLRNSTVAESQSQLADDAIKEELMKEAVLSDHEENSKRYTDDLNKVKPLDSSADDSLSVKPIGKGAIYTTRSNYRPMKKIEVQSLKPYVRDPDDNSWRNESLSYLGIVFKAKNASKPFTQVLKNKTEAELNNWVEKENKNEVPDLRERLEKITEVRKSKKKKLNQFGEMVYTDYEVENSGESSSTRKPDAVSMDVSGELFFGNPPSTSVSTEAGTVRTEAATQRTTTPGVYMYKEKTTTTKKPKKMNKFAEYYDTTDEDDADYLSLSKIDLKKFTTRLFGMEAERVTTPTPMTTYTKQMKTMLPERKPTVQYFPPRREPQKVNVNDYDNDFQRKVNMFSYTERPKSTNSVTPPPATMDYKTTQYLKETSVIPGPARQNEPGNLAKNVYVTIPPRVVDHNNNRYPGNDESFNRASYVIKHFKDLIDEAVKDDYDKSVEFIQPYTESPYAVAMKKDQKTQMDEDYEYDANFRRDILNRFVDNFNQNSERFKVDFPILYNSSVVHMQADEGGKVVASSSAFLKRQYGAAQAPGPGRPCCDMKVELSPAYELHYYVPEQEEKEEAEKPTMPFSYRL